MRPGCGDDSEPARDCELKSALNGVRRIAKLFGQPSGAEQGNASCVTAKAPALPHQPDVEIKHARRVREGSDSLSPNRDSMLVAFLKKSFTERNHVLGGLSFLRGLGLGKPKVHVFEKMKTRAVGQRVAAGPVVGAEENCGAEDSLKALDDAAVMTAVFGEVKEFKHLSGAAESDHATVLPESERGDPDRDEPILAVGKTKPWMPGDFQEKLSVAAQIPELFARRTAKRDTAEHERPGVVSEILFPGVALLADEADRFEAFEVSLRNGNPGGCGGLPARRSRQLSLGSYLCD